MYRLHAEKTKEREKNIHRSMCQTTVADFILLLKSLKNFTRRQILQMFFSSNFFSAIALNSKMMQFQQKKRKKGNAHK